MQKLSKSEVFDHLFKSPEEVRRRNLTRNRTSYQFWKFQYDALRHQHYTKKQTESLLRWVWCLLNTRHTFGSPSKAAWSEESLDLVVEDHRMGRLK